MQYLKGFQILKSFIGNGNGFTLIDSLKSEAKSFSTDPNIKKIDSFLKLFYKLFLYSIIGVFAKLISKIFKL
ncbi:MAG: hypothetical protein A3I68_05170 [Candidatus Melainabacteria bacterium RIFCSPLOWO2_02_FULL_35_15]|nr:MAG: hypothetical protein A3F80_07480 [Candidatus Melainabacteria bacterium RIFCSPLOWO2_12_FULL_35_11]OGI12842.1 MAG: hypothetical protein A3I68_05170 [Candidatus Melainabacteria bacterium RIFCSPLOWO2_02_FULL_35_15]